MATYSRQTSNKQHYKQYSRDDGRFDGGRDRRDVEEDDSKHSSAGDAQRHHSRDERSGKPKTFICDYKSETTAYAKAAAAATAPLLDETTPISETEQQKRVELLEKVDDFENFGLSTQILRGIFAYGFEQPSPIQQVAIRPLSAGYDIIAQAQSGFGKTATFCIGALSRITLSSNTTQVIILSHTREMATQVWAVISCLNKYHGCRINLSTPSIPAFQNKNELLGYEVSTQFKSTSSDIDTAGGNFAPPCPPATTGGDLAPPCPPTTGGNFATPAATQLVNDIALDERKIPQLVVGTPGRVLDMINKNYLRVDRLKLLVLDEADELLSSGFRDQIREIYGNLSRSTQSALFSATYNSEVLELTKSFTVNPIKILIKNEELTLDGIKQYYIDVVENQYKYETLCDLYKILEVAQTIIFCNSQKTVEYLAQKMIANNFTVASIHGNLSVLERETTMSEFRRGKLKVLIATDVIGRGIDVQSVSIVINYELPQKISNYIHRIGRCGRYGRKGCGISFVCKSDASNVEHIQNYYHTTIKPLPASLDNLLD